MTEIDEKITQLRNDYLRTGLNVFRDRADLLEQQKGKYYYEIVKPQSPMTPAEIKKELNVLGERGWRFCGMDGFGNWVFIK